VRYLTLAESVTIAEAVTGIEAAILTRVARLELFDSALHAPQAGFGEVELSSEFVDKAAVLVVRIARNHPLPDGNKRLARQAPMTSTSHRVCEPGQAQEEFGLEGGLFGVTAAVG